MIPRFALRQPDAMRVFDLARGILVAGLCALLKPLPVELELIPVGITALVDRHHFPFPPRRALTSRPDTGRDIKTDRSKVGVNGYSYGNPYDLIFLSYTKSHNSVSVS